MRSATLTINGDGMHSFYRVKGDRITQINRKMPHMAFYDQRGGQRRDTRMVSS